MATFNGTARQFVGSIIGGVLTSSTSAIGVNSTTYTPRTASDPTFVNWVFDGNSIVSGGNVASPSVNSYPAQTISMAVTSQATHPTEIWRGFNVGVSGALTTDRTAAFTADVHPRLVPGLKCVVSLLEYGNHRGQPSVSEQQAIDAVIAYGVKARGLGWLFALHTCPPRSPTPTAFDTANQYFRNHPEHYDYLVDHALDANLTDPTNTTYYADGTHPTIAGYTALAQLAHDAVVV